MILNTVDLFCGLGGQTAGILEAARERRVKLNLVAVNHWDTAINTHSLNHPTVHHICEPVENLIPSRVVPSRRLHLLAAGCECTFHSNARGGGPCNEQSRSQAWQLVRWATDIHVENILMENVWEFTDWGPLHPVTHRPIKSRKGEFFQAFISALRNLGRSVEWRKQCAADFGDPTSRKRFILISRANNQPIEWPKPTHGDPSLIPHSALRTPRLKHSALRTPHLKPWRTAREIIDWQLKGESIFNRKKPLCENTLARIAAGLRKFGGEHAEPFLIILRGTGASHLNNGQSVDEPLSTVSTSGKHHYLVQPEPYLVNLKGKSKAASLRKPSPTITAHARHLMLVEPEFILPPEGFYRGNTAKSLDKPLPTITASRGRAFQLVQGKMKPFVIGQQSGATPRGVDKPLPTVATAGAIRLVEPFLASYHNRPKGKKANRVHSLNQPLPTVDTSNRYQLVEPFVINGAHQGNNQSRVHSLKKPLPTVTGAHRGDLRLVEPFIYSSAHGEDKRKRGRIERRVKSLGQPLPTVTGVKGFALCEPVLVQTDHTGGNGSYTRSVHKPLGTIVSKQNLLLVEPMIAKYYATGVCKPIGEPLDTVTTKDRFMLVEFQHNKQGRIPKSALRTPRLIGELDILTRMLQPHELAAAHSLAGFKLTGTKEDQTKQIGNSVPKMLAKAHAKMLLR